MIGKNGNWVVLPIQEIPNGEIVDLMDSTAARRPTAVGSGHPNSSIAQSRMSDLVRGKWDKFSLEMLIRLEG